MSLFFSASPGGGHRCEAPQSHLLKPCREAPAPSPAQPPCSPGKTAKSQAEGPGLLPSGERSTDASAPKPSLIRRGPSGPEPGPEMEQKASCLMPKSQDAQA
ncbi:hypothetical protein D623_10006004 [Myotis brandtii]|uniref:Uncharacterized protein n=1 Tax=Myotis brandtii TaxID=109478 RepID=S7PWS3_MYOBR|nr:hypothetical protein D623_10006004 [Myotis brandtii]